MIIPLILCLFVKIILCLFIKIEVVSVDYSHFNFYLLISGK